MKAVRFHEHGGPEVLVYEDAPDPRPGPGEVLVRVRAASINHLDLWIRQGIPSYGTQLPHIGGNDLAGEILEVGTNIRDWQAGERVMAWPGLSCGECEFCLRGDETLCRSFKILGAHVPGVFAELAAVPARNLFRIPDGVSFEEAAAIPLVFVTAWHMLITRCAMTPGEDVLVLGAGSGVGTAAIQIARACGARVFAVAGSDWKLEKAGQLGAVFLINRTSQDFADVVRSETTGRGVDIVFEHVGAATFATSLRSLARGGRLVTCGATTGPEAVFDIRPLFAKELSIVGSMLGTRHDLAMVLRLVCQRIVHGVVDSVFPLENLRAAQEKVARGEFFGKVVVSVP